MGYALLLIASLLLGVVAVLLLTRGLRGRRVGDHPHCGKCNHDLFGLPASSVNCPECGADLALPRSRRTGKFQRRPTPLALGALLLVIALAGLITGGSLVHRHVDLSPFLPDGYLALRLTRSNGRTLLNVSAEVKDRLDRSTFDQRPLARLRERILMIQADRTQSWHPEWGEVFFRAWHKFQVPNHQWRRFLEQAPVISPQSRPRVRLGDPLPVGVKINEVRAGMSTPAFTVRLVQVRLDGRTEPLQESKTKLHGSSMRGASISQSLNAEAATRLLQSPGLHTLTIDVEVEADGHRQTLTMPVPVIVLEEDEPTYTVNADPSMRDRFLSGFRAELDEGTDQPGNVELKLQMGHVPAEFAFEVLLKLADGSEQYLTHTVGPVVDFKNLTMVVPDHGSAITGVVLRPTSREATTTFDVTTPWDDGQGDLLVPVVRAATRPVR